ncbi:MAG: GMC oxidoreductase [Cyanobacteria bacterium P01_F01_bin.150]
MSPDICVVGGGPAGIAVAMMASRTGKSVLLAESGSRQHRPEDLNRGKVQQAVGVADRTDPKLIDGPSLYDSDYMHSGRTRVPGGSSRKWGVRSRLNNPFCLRLACPDDIDFQQIDDYDVPAWPIPHKDIQTYLHKSVEFFGLSQVDFRSQTTGAYPLDQNTFVPGMLYFAPGSVVYEQRYQQIDSTDNINIQTGWTLKQLVTNAAQDQVDFLEFVDESGEIHKVNAKQVVIATGGVENSRILLNAVDEGQLKDPYDNLGRWFMDHPHLSFGILKPHADVESLGVFHDFQDHQANTTLGHYSLSERAAREEKLLRFSISLVGVPKITTSPVVAAGSRLMNMKRQRYSVRETSQMVTELVKHPIEALQFAQYKFGKGPRHHTALGGWSRKDTRLTDIDGLKVEVMMAQRPSPDNRVRLLPERDRLGNRKACLQWSWSQPEVDSYWRSVQLTKRHFEAIDAGEYIDPVKLGCGKVPRGGTGWHQMGGTRMSSSPEHGSVDANSRYHGVENLYVAGSSIFPSSVGYANPTLTLVALSLRLGEYLAAL